MALGAGYDYSVATFSPDGKVFQVEYALKAIEATGLVIGGVVNDGVVLGVEKSLPSPLAVPSTGRRVFKLAPHAICAVAGSLPDARRLVDEARQECATYARVWGTPIPGSVLADRIGLFVHGYTAMWSTRPFGCGIVIAIAENVKPRPFVASTTINKNVDQSTTMCDDEKPKRTPDSYSLWFIDSTGAAFKYRGTAIARGAPGAKSDLEKLKLDELDVHQAVKEFTKIIHFQHQENAREKPLTVELIRLNHESCELVPESEVEEANTEAVAWLERLDA